MGSFYPGCEKSRMETNEILDTSIALDRSLAVRTSDGDFKHIQAVMPELKLK